jgi:hypothetical protein
MATKMKTVEVQVKVVCCDRCNKEAPNEIVPDGWWHLQNELSRKSDQWQGPNKMLICDTCFDTITN